MDQIRSVVATSIMKHTLKSSVDYLLSGIRINKVSIIEFASADSQVLCRHEELPEKIKDCLYEKPKLNGGTGINEALDYVLDPSNVLLLRDYRNVIAVFTGGEPNDSIQFKVNQARNNPNVHALTGFGIGNTFEDKNGQAYKQLSYLIDSTKKNFDEHEHLINDFDSFELSRLDLQKKICSL
jgi:uncharacterized protein YegL